MPVRATQTPSSWSRSWPCLRERRRPWCSAPASRRSPGWFLQILEPGDHLLVSDVSYAGTAEVTRGLLRRKGIDVTVADMSHLGDVKAALQPRTRLIYAETPCNPVLKLADIAPLAQLAHGHGAELCVDGTFATPAVTRPLDLGADYVVYSLTKYMCGHGDALGGAVLGQAAAMNKLRHEVGVHLGATLSAFNCWLILRGLETLPMRMAAYARGASQVAQFLEDHPKVTWVRYPGLPSHPQHELAQRQMSSPSGMIAFDVVDHDRFGRGLKDHLQVFYFAASLGLSRSLILDVNPADLQRTTFQLDDEHLRRYRQWAGRGSSAYRSGLRIPATLLPTSTGRCHSSSRVGGAGLKRLQVVTSVVKALGWREGDHYDCK